MNGLDLFSGIGGIGLALKPWVRTVAYCESDRYAQGVLLSRMRSGDIDQAPIWDDVRTLKSEMLPRVDIIYGGFPCQDISVAGTGAGLAGERSGLFFEIIRLVGELRPRFIFLENVPALAVRGLDRVLLHLDALGYDARWTIVSAAEMGAPHLRERIWILAHSDSGRCRQGSDGIAFKAYPEMADSPGVRGREGKQISRQRRSTMVDTDWSSSEMANAERPRLEGLWGEYQLQHGSNEDEASWRGWWESEPDVGRVAYGVSSRVDRLRCCGNSVVPQAAREAFKRLSGIGG